MPHHPHIRQNLIPYLNIEDGDAMIAFCEKAFGAELKFAMKAPTNQHAHVHMEVEDTTLMFSAMHPPHLQRVKRAPTDLPLVTLLLYVKDCDATHDRAVAAGAKSVEAPSDMFWGDRSARVVDPQGIVWMISALVEEVSPEESQRRLDAMFKAHA